MYLTSSVFVIDSPFHKICISASRALEGVAGQSCSLVIGYAVTVGWQPAGGDGCPLAAQPHPFKSDSLYGSPEGKRLIGTAGNSEAGKLQPRSLTPILAIKCVNQ